MDRDDEIRAAIRQYAEGDVGSPDLEAIRFGRRAARRYGPVQTLLAVAIVVLIAVLGVFLVTTSLGRDEQQPIEPTPSPSPSMSARPSPSPTPTPTQTASEFAVNPGAGVNPGPIGGVGDTISGLRLDAVQIRAGTCGGTPCPARFTMTVTNTTESEGTWEVFAYIYRNGYAELGNATQMTLAAGEQAKARITIDTSQSAGTAGTYTWNWSAGQAR